MIKHLLNLRIRNTINACFYLKEKETKFNFPKIKQNRVVFLTTVLLFITISISTVEYDNDVLATSYDDRYDSGYDYGCDDAFISDRNDRYLNQPGKGPDYHTDDFMDGYYDGFRICAVNVFDNGGDDDDNNNDDDDGDKFIVRIKFVDDTPHLTLYGPTFVRAYIEEYPSYSTANLDLNNLWSDAVPSGSSQIYITEMPCCMIHPFPKIFS